MSSALVNYSSFQSVLPIFIDAAVKGAILVLIAAVAAYLLRNRSAASRHAVWTSAVVGHLTIPILALLLPAWTMPLLPTASWMQPESSAVSTTRAPSLGADEAATVPTAATPVANQTKAGRFSRALFPPPPNMQKERGGQASPASKKA